ncbi:Cof-type HAD-IIB family hydrolase [Anaerosporobacter sp.]|uniref:Cof-type HAD-IIB family hydrolase n=1 Tax=Anaerosporobacter sp. TaxID=1872529 RepID=UPI00286EEAF1|nr:Cof-type HAD-IIB family hydrolase [Anaerosporobacter sp.]
MSDKKIKLIAIDIDGTLVNSDKELSLYTKQVLRKAIANGIQIIPCTGRIISGIPECITKELDISYIISANGANVWDVKQKCSIYSEGMSSKYVASMLAIIEEYDCLFDVFIDGGAFAEEDRLIISNRYVGNNSFSQYITNTRYGVNNLKNFVIASNQPVDKINLFFSDLETRNELIEKLKPFSECEFSSGISHNLEITKKGIHKGKTLQELAEKLDITVEEIMAIGDGENDLDMLEVAGISVAMENAAESVLDMAQFITKSNDEDGVACAVIKYMEELRV